jgi:DnaJ-class molecular chaperone
VIQIGEAYQILSKDDLRKQYDKFGKEKAMPGGGFGTELTESLYYADLTLEQRIPPNSLR